MVPLQLLGVSLVGFLQREQHDVIEYLHEENRVLKAQLRSQRVRLTDANGGAWLFSARVSDEGSWRRLRRLSHPTRFAAGTASSSLGNGRTN